MKKFLLLFIIVTATLRAQPVNELYSKSLKAYKHGQYELFLTYAAKLDSIRPWHPVYTYNLAAAYALNMKSDKAIPILKKIVLMDGNSGFADDADFASLRALPEYRDVLSLKATVLKPVETSQKVVTLSEKNLHPEGLYYLKKKKLWLAGSIRKGKIVTFDSKTGKCADWLDTDYPVFSLKADADEKYLWAVTSAVEEMEGYKPEMEGRGEVLKINLKTKAIESRYTVGGKHVYGDLAVAKNGTVYVSDSYNPTIYRIVDDAMAPWYSINGGFNNFQGICLNADESKVYLADYFNGIAEIPVGDPSQRRWLSFPAGTIQKGIDGIAWNDGSIVAIYNGVKPIRIIRYFLEAAGNIGRYQVIDNNRPEFNEPTIPHVVKDKCYFFANCPWPAYDRRHQLDESKFENPMLFTFSLND